MGSTCCAIRTRVCEHKSRIQLGCGAAPMVSHFQELSHNCDRFTFLILEKAFAHKYNRMDISTLLLQETFWIHRLKTFVPHGLNTT